MYTAQVVLNEEYEKKLRVIMNYMTSDWKKATISDALKYAIHNQWVNIQVQYYEEGTPEYCDREWLKNYEKYN